MNAALFHDAHFGVSSEQAGSRPTLRRYAVATLLHLTKNALTFVAPWNAPCVRIWSERQDEKIRLWIEDDGIGIEPEHQRRSFWVFERLSPAYPGMGIGLAITAKAIQRMGGRVGVESAPGKGSKFWLELPAAPANALAEA